MANTILITGANRGLGLEFTKQYAAQGWQVLACCRDLQDAADLNKLSAQFPQIKCYQVDVTNEASIQALQKTISMPIDILLNNAGFLEQDELGDLSSDIMMKTFLINAVGPIKMLEAFKGHVAKSEIKLIASLSSSMGSISENTSGGYYSYRASKSALNMFMKSAAIDVAGNKIKVLLLHPGWVKTRMGGNSASLEAVDSVTGMRKVIANYNPKIGEAQFIRYNGEIVAW